MKPVQNCTGVIFCISHSCTPLRFDFVLAVNFFCFQIIRFVCPLSSNVETVFLLFLSAYLTLCLMETPFSTFANRADPDQAALVRAA